MVLFSVICSPPRTFKLGADCVLCAHFSTWLLSQGRGAWAAISVVGVAETATAYTGQPHGESDPENIDVSKEVH